MMNVVTPDAQVAINWGPCASFTNNVFTHLFSRLPRIAEVQDSSSCNVTGTAAGFSDDSYVPVIAAAKVEAGSKPFPGCMPATGMANDFAIEDAPDKLVELVRDLKHGVNPLILDRVKKFKRQNNWTATDNVISIHVRYGNPNATTGKTDHAFGKRAAIMNDVELFLRVLISRAEELASKLKWPTHKVFIATDTKLVIDTVEDSLKDLDHIMTRKDAFFADFAHPLTWVNLRNNNAGPRCRLIWWEDPIVDWLLLGSGNAMIAPTFSGFVYFPATMVLSNEGLLCHKISSPPGASHDLLTIDCVDRTKRIEIILNSSSPSVLLKTS